MSDDTENKTQANTSSSAKPSRHRSVGILPDDQYDLIKCKLEGAEFPKASKNSHFYHVCGKIKKFQLTLQEIHNPVHGVYRQEIIDGDKKIAIRTSELNDVIRKFYTELRGSGAKKIRTMISQYYTGISQELIQKFIDQQDDTQLLRPKFKNAPNLKPVTSKTPMGRHQVDLVDLSGMSVEIDGETFLYVLSVIDVFTRFLWLRPLSSKSSGSVALELHRLYFEYGWGSPRVLQCDQGSEFKGAVNQLCIDMGTKIVRSRAHHPQSQGKSERSHRDWKAHLEFDFKNRSQDESFNWVEKLPAYARIHNESVHSALGCSPYRAMFGCPPVHFQHLLKAGNSVDAYSCSEEEPSELSAEGDEDTEEQNVQDRIEAMTDLRRKVLESSLTKSEKMVKKKQRTAHVSIYGIGERVLVRTEGKDSRVKRGGRKKGMAKCSEGIVAEIDSEMMKYKISFENGESKWIHVSSITSLTREKEKKREKKKPEDSMPDTNDERRSGKKGKTQGQKGNEKQIPEMSDGSETQKGNKTPTLRELALEASFYNLEIVNNEGQGNCMFIALAQQLQIKDIATVSHIELREKIMQYVQGKRRVFKNFIDKKHYPTFRDYVIKMRKVGEWGDNIILQATADVYKVTIRVITTAANKPIFIEPTEERHSRAVLDIGHLCELHYVTLIPMASEKDTDTQEVHMSEPETDESASDSKYEINSSVWEKKKEDVAAHVQMIANKDAPDEQLQRHEEFLSKFPKPDKRLNFAEGYLSHAMQEKILHYLTASLTTTRLKDTRRIYSGIMRIFKCKVEKRLENLTRKHMIAATDYLMRVGVKEAIIYILMDTMKKSYKEVNQECTSTEIDASQIPGRGVHITVDDE